MYVFGGEIGEAVDPVLVADDGTVTNGAYPQAAGLNGGYTILDLPSCEAALEWAKKIAAPCRSSQEVRVFRFDTLA
ncbi:YciI family protein [Herbidospora mongoliensis]|uniref:YciI family protein n=1 Tax=Herbidospora mongoliensis TaxID=688067 RepID=UPI001C3F4A4F|nr:YciI family protein [Herbidospora mongoliensis]